MSFNLIQNPADLPFAQIRQAQSSFVQYLPTSSAIGQNFAAGEVVIPWSLQSPLWMDLSKSYVRLVIETSNPLPVAFPPNTGSDNGSPFMQYQGVAPAYHQGPSLFSRGSFSINGVIVSNITDNFSQIAAFSQRILRPNGLTKTFGASMDFVDPNFSARQNRVTAPDVIQGYPDDRNLTVCLYDIPGIAQPASSGTPGFQASWNSAQTTLTITADDASSSGGWLTTKAFIKENTRVTVLETAASTVALTGVVRSVNISSTTVLEIVMLDVPALGNTSFSNPAQVFFTNYNPPEPIMNQYEILMRPPLSIFETGQMIPGGAFCELRLQPFSQSIFQGRAVETLRPNLQAGKDFQVIVKEFSFFLYQCQGPRIDAPISWLLPLDTCYTMTTQAITSGANSMGQFLFDVPASTYCLAIGLQNRDLNNSAVSSTRMTVGYPTRDPGLEQSVNNLFVTFKGVTQPQQLQQLLYKDYDPALQISPNNPGTAGINGMALRYMQNQLVDGLGFSPGGCESFSDWLQAGPIYLSYWPADSSSESTRVMVNITTSKDLTGTNGSVGANVCLFAVYRQVATISCEAGRWSSIQVQNL